jgi:NAD(P)H-hydrate epimerase
MVTISGEKSLRTIPSLEKIHSIAIGPGLGKTKQAKSVLLKLLRKNIPLVLDADALNMLATGNKPFRLVPRNAILTPHAGEFRRLAGDWKSWKQKINLQQEISSKHKITIVLKGKYTSVSSPDGMMSFNSTGNAGMAKGGSGDVLTGIVAALLAQNYKPEEAARLGVYIHGRAADLAVQNQSEESLLPTDIITMLGAAFRELYS